MVKKILALLLVACMIFCFAACDKKEGEKKPAASKVDTSFKKGEPKAQGDVFELPSIEKGGAGAPVIGQVSKEALPDDSVIVAGQNFSGNGLKVYIYSQSKKGNGKTTEAKATVTEDGLMTATVDKSLEYGIYGIYAENSKGKSNIKLINVPEIWYMDFNNVTKGEKVSVYGANLTTDKGKKAFVYLLSDDGKYCQVEVTSANPHKVTFKVPDNLKDGKSYQVKLHCGHGGEYGFVTVQERLIYSASKLMKFEGKTIDVTDFGADPKNVENDDTAAIADAIASAQDGDTVYFPAGVYFCNQNIEINSSIRIMGAGKKNTYFLTANALTGCLFEVLVGGVEFTDVAFQHKRNAGKLISGFISYNGDATSASSRNLYIHDCDFVQQGNEKAKSKYAVISIHNGSGIVIEDNTFECSVFTEAYSTNKLYIRNNKIISNMYVGSYYGQDASFFNNVNKLDLSKNIIHGGDAEEDDIIRFDTNDLTCGRATVFQSNCEKLYIGDNDIAASGIPNANAGELVLLEQLSVKFDGHFSNISGDGFTVDGNAAFSKGDIVAVAQGTGKGQTRIVSDFVNKKVVLNEPFDVAPNAESRIVITRAFSDIAVYRNSFQGHSNYANIPGGTTAIQVYGGTFNLFFNNNKMLQLPEGICITPYYAKAEGNSAKALVYWCHFDGNTFDDCGVGVRYTFPSFAGSGKAVVENSIGVTLRRNDFKYTPDYSVSSGWAGEGGIAIQMGAPATQDGGQKLNYWQGILGNTVLIENCKFAESAQADIYFMGCQGNTVLRNNTAKSGEVKTKTLPNCNDGIKAK